MAKRKKKKKGKNRKEKQGEDGKIQYKIENRIDN